MKPSSDHWRVSCHRATTSGSRWSQRAYRARTSAFQLGIFFEALVGFGIDIAHPLGDILFRTFAAVEVHVIPQPLDHVQPDIAGVIGAHHVETGKIQDAAQHIAQDGAAQVAHVESLVGVRLGKFHHHLVVVVRSFAKTVLLLKTVSSTRRAYSAVEK